MLCVWANGIFVHCRCKLKQRTAYNDVRPNSGILCQAQDLKEDSRVGLLAECEATAGPSLPVSRSALVSLKRLGGRTGQRLGT